MKKKYFCFAELKNVFIFALAKANKPGQKSPARVRVLLKTKLT